MLCIYYDITVKKDGILYYLYICNILIMLLQLNTVKYDLVLTVVGLIHQVIDFT